MLSKVLSREQCASCRFCCSFRRCSLWETPLFPPETVKKLSEENEYGVIGQFRNGKMCLEQGYKTEDPEEEVPCQFLDPARGCLLQGEDKPFDCKIWPLRIMERNGERVIAYTPTCTALGATPPEALQALVRETLGQEIFSYAADHPEIVKLYREGFPIILEA